MQTTLSPVPTPESALFRPVPADVLEFPPTIPMERMIELAEGLARELEFQPAMADAVEVAWYRQRAGGDAVCTLRRAELLKQMTLYQCFVIQMRRGTYKPLALEVVVKKRNEVFEALALLAFMLFLFVVVPLWLDRNTPDDSDLQPTPGLSAPIPMPLPGGRL